MNNLDIADNSKICFITCVNNENMYAMSLELIKKLNLPEGIRIETLAMRGEKGMAQGYNKAMRLSDAKYKVYLHQDTLIMNENFIFEILSIFKNNSKIGLLGLAGYKSIPSNGIWWETQDEFGYGKVMHFAYNNGPKPVNFDVFGLWQYGECDPNDSYVRVKGIDGLLMATQYDLPWREELFDGWHFYDVSQSLEFARSGYEVVVPWQEDFWVAHASISVDKEAEEGKMITYLYYREIFLKEYKSDILDRSLADC